MGNRQEEPIAVLLWENFLIMVVIHYQQFSWFLELVLQCSWGQTLTGCFFVVLLGHSCSIVHTGRHMFLEHCDLECFQTSNFYCPVFVPELM